MATYRQPTHPSRLLPRHRFREEFLGLPRHALFRESTCLPTNHIPVPS